MTVTKTSVLAGIICFGSLWGALEATLGGALANLPNHGAVMANIGFLIMGAAIAIYKRPGVALASGFVAASFKLLSAVLFGVSPLAKMILNPMAAIILEALALDVVVVVFWEWYHKSRLVRAGVGALGMYLSYIGVAFVFLYVLRKVPPQLGAGHLSAFVLKEGGVAALFALVSNPLGYRLGKLAELWLEWVSKARPRLFYGGATLLTLLCWSVAIWEMLT